MLEKTKDFFRGKKKHQLASFLFLILPAFVLTYILFINHEIRKPQYLDEPAHADTIFDVDTCILGTGPCQLVTKDLQTKLKEESKNDPKNLKLPNSKDLELKLTSKKLEFIHTKVTPMSSINGTQKVRYYTLIAASYPQEKAVEGFYQCAKGKDLGCAIEMLKVNPQYKTLGGQTERVFAENLLGSLRLTKKKEDKKTDLPKGGKSPAKHYYFTQRLNGKEVYGSNLSVHIRDGKNVYLVKGRVTTDQKIPKEKIKDKKLVENLLREARKKAPKLTKFTVRNKNTVIYNGELLGYDDPGNDLALHADVLEDSKNPIFATNYVISKTTGEILVENPLSIEVPNREVCIHNDPKLPIKCTPYRQEGKSARFNDSEGKRVFDWLGDLYDYYFRHYGRNSFDNRGGKIKVEIDHPACWSGHTSYNPNITTITWCRDHNNSDVLFAHEYGHSIVHAETPNIGFSNQSGSLDEALASWFAADMFGIWDTHGNEGGKREDFRNPHSTNQPQDIFDRPPYVCDDKDDFGGKHKNTGPISLALYKASEDPPLYYENESCETKKYPPLGRNVVSWIVYHYLVNYLQRHDNFFDFYVDMQVACNDVYNNPQLCMSLVTSMQYTKLHKQVSGWPKSPVCYGQPEMTEDEAYEQSCQRQRAKRPPKELDLPLPLSRKKDAGRKDKKPVGVKVDAIEGSWAKVPITMPLIQQVYGFISF